MNAMGVAEAAERLGVSPRRIRQMLSSGDLAGERIGRDWLVDRGDLERAGRRVVAGRPWSSASAWAVLAVAEGQDGALSPLERSRARRRLRDVGLAGLVSRLGARCELRRFYAHPAALLRLGGEAEFVRSGVSAAADVGADIVASDALEGYVPRSVLPELMERYGLDGDADRPNIVLRVVDDEVWPFAAGLSVAPWPVVAVDLMEADDERSRRSGADLVVRS